MAKQFSNLSRGGDQFKKSLSSFVVGKSDNPPVVNPLADKVTRKARPKSEPVVSKAKEPAIKEARLKDISQRPESKPVNPQPVLPVLPDVPESSFHTPDTTLTVRKDLPLDLRSRTVLYSHNQLNDLRKVVLLRKASGDFKYSIQEAVHEALELYLSSVRKLVEYPKDFEPYSVAISKDLFDRVNKHMFTIKALDDKRYCLMYAVYDALNLYLDKNKAYL